MAVTCSALTTAIPCGHKLRRCAKLTGVCAAEVAVRRAPHAGRYVLTDEVASGAAMFDTTRLDPADNMNNGDSERITKLGRRAAEA